MPTVHDMPQLQAAKKALRSSARKRLFNDRWRRKVRAAIHSVRDAIEKGDKVLALKAAVLAEKVLDRSARRNIIHPNKAARKKSRIQKAIAKLQTR